MSELETCHVNSSACDKSSPNSHILIISCPNEEGVNLVKVYNNIKDTLNTSGGDL